MSQPPVILAKPLSGTTEVVRSFSYKLHVGSYESRDFFCSQKAECAMEDAERVSALLHEFCKKQVLRAVDAWVKQNQVPPPSPPEKRRIA